VDSRDELLSALDAVEPAELDYSDWVNVGMALHHEGADVSEWDVWSRRDARRYRPGECKRKWAGFGESITTPVTGATIYRLARDVGWTPESTASDEALEWSSPIVKDDPPWLIANLSSPEPTQITVCNESTFEPTFEPVTEMTRYLNALFDPDEYVSVVTASYEREGRLLPASKGLYTITAGETIERLVACGGDTGKVIGDYRKEAGAWIRINPMDGKGVGNDNVADFRYCLVESDSMPIDEQNTILRKLELPIAALVHSGGKSLHAIVRVDATDKRQYAERVKYVFDTCASNGLDVDPSNKNPSRLSRLPGCVRGDNRQYIVATNIGRASYDEWLSFCTETRDGIPDAIDFSSECIDDVAPAEIIIEGMLARGEKMLLAGPSKAGKSFALIELCVALAEGRQWLGRTCTPSDVLYVNLELKKDTRKRRMQEVYTALGIPPVQARRIHSLDLRGKQVTLEALTNRLVKQAVKRRCDVIIIDPIYKVLQGDENSSEDVSAFCTKLDYLIEALGCSVIYCHHYSKGASNYTSAMNRASGSSVFSRDADALVSLDELTLDTDARKARFNTLGCDRCLEYLDIHDSGAKDNVGQDDLVVIDRLRAHCRQLLPTELMNNLIDELDALEASCMDSVSAWRVEGTLRDFPRFKPIDTWYQWPLHVVDDSGVLGDIQGEQPRWKKNKSDGMDAQKRRRDKEAQDAQEKLEGAFSRCRDAGGQATVTALVQEMNLSRNAVKGHIDRSKKFIRDSKGNVTLSEPKGVSGVSTD
jgi:RecA-family ATPase